MADLEMAIGDRFHCIGHGSALDATGIQERRCAHAFFTSRSCPYVFRVIRRPGKKWQWLLEPIVRLSVFDFSLLLEDLSPLPVGRFITKIHQPLSDSETPGSRQLDRIRVRPAWIDATHSEFCAEKRRWPDAKALDLQAVKRGTSISG